MNTISFLKKYAFIAAVIFFVSCDKDFNELDTPITNDDIHSDMIHYEGHVAAYDHATGPVQTNNLPLNSLGVYDNAVFGKTVSHVVSQLELSTSDPDFTGKTIDSVYIYVPYYSTLQSTDSDGAGTYTLDSIYGNEGGRIKLSVYENGYYLRDDDPNTSAQFGQRYYSDGLSPIEQNKRGAAADGSSVANGERLNNGESSENDEFTFSAAEVTRYADVNGVSKIVERMAPGIFMYLNKDFFQKKILDAPDGQLLNNSIFKNYFRGLYFKVEQVGDESALAMPKFSEGKITIKYHDSDLTTVTPDDIDTYTINLSGNTVNYFENTNTTAYNDALAASNETQGDEKLYIKGGQGSMALIDILDDADLQLLKHDDATGKKMLINEADLTFYVDKETMDNVKEPMRVYLYDATNNTPMYDYYTDITTNTVDPKYNKYVHGGILETSEDGTGYRYKIRITDHVNNIINRDSTNVKLGLVVTESINLTNNSALKNTFTSGSTEIKNVPAASAMHPFGTVLYGSNPAVPDDKRLKLEIFYTKPN